MFVSVCSGDVPCQQVAFEASSHSWDIFCSNCDGSFNTLPIISADLDDGPGGTSASTSGNAVTLLRLRSRTDTGDSHSSMDHAVATTTSAHGVPVATAHGVPVSDAATSPISDELLRLGVSSPDSGDGCECAVLPASLVSPMGPPRQDLPACVSPLEPSASVAEAWGAWCVRVCLCVWLCVHVFCVCSACVLVFVCLCARARMHVHGARGCNGVCGWCLCARVCMSAFAFASVYSYVFLFVWRNAAPIVPVTTSA